MKYPKPILAVLILTCVTYAISLKNDFVTYDDQVILTDNKIVQDFDVKAMFTEVSAFDFVPLTLLSFALENKIFGKTPFIYHLDNLLLHLFNTALVFFLVIGLTGENLFITMVSAALFGIHPMHVESVAWITERKDVLFGAFYLLGLLQFLKFESEKKVKSYVLAFIFFILSALAKPAAVSFPLVLFLISPHFKIRSILEKLPFFGVSLGLIFIHWSTHRVAILVGATPEILSILRQALDSIVFYFSKLTVPTKLSAYYERGAVELGWLDYSIALAGFGFLVFTAVTKKNRRKIILGSLLFFLITLAPTFRIIPLSNNFLFADRYTYLPSIGYTTALVSAMGERLTIKAIAGLITLIFSFMSMARIGVWQDGDILWNDVVTKYPKTSVGYYNIGVANYKRGINEKALEMFKKAISLNPSYLRALVSLALFYKEKSMWNESIVQYQRILEIQPNDPASLLHMGICHFQKGSPKEAIGVFKTATAIYPAFFEAHYNLGVVYYTMNDFAASKIEFLKTLEIEPSYQPAKDFLARMHQTR